MHTTEGESMNTTDHRAEAERMLADAYDYAAQVPSRGADADSTAAWVVPHALLAIHDLLDARLPKEGLEPLPEWEHALRLREERDAARDELARARTQIVALTGDLPGKDEVVVRRADVEFVLEFGCLRGTVVATLLRDALEARS